MGIACGAENHAKSQEGSGYLDMHLARFSRAYRAKNGHLSDGLRCRREAVMLKVTRKELKMAVYTVTLTDEEAYKLEEELCNLEEAHGMCEESTLYALYKLLPVRER